MNTANLELCKELYALSGWLTSDHRAEYVAAPAYDLGYLIRKLPTKLKSRKEKLYLQPCIKPENKGRWSIGYVYSGIGNIADTPEDALAKLAIELFKKDVLTKQGKEQYEQASPNMETITMD